MNVLFPPQTGRVLGFESGRLSAIISLSVFGGLEASKLLKIRPTPGEGWAIASYPELCGSCEAGCCGLKIGSKM